jgi:hypothetical protein
VPVLREWLRSSSKSRQGSVGAADRKSNLGFSRIFSQVIGRRCQSQGSLPTGAARQFNQKREFRSQWRACLGKHAACKFFRISGTDNPVSENFMGND